MDKTELNELLSIIKHCNMNKDDVIQEAELAKYIITPELRIVR